MELSKREQEMIGRCAEENAPACGFKQRNLCPYYSVWKDNQLGCMRTKENQGINSLVIVNCSKCPERIILKFDVNLHVLQTKDLPNAGWKITEHEDAASIYTCPDCSQTEREVEVLGQAMLKKDGSKTGQ